MSIEMTCITVKTTCKSERDRDASQLSAKRPKHPYSKEEFAKYEDVLPSVQTVADYKHLQTSQVECDASLAMQNKKRNMKVTLHYDSTTTNSIDGEWPSLISCFSDGQTFRHRPIFFAFEDWKQIVSLIVETYECLAAAATIASGKTVKAANLWGKTDAFMTDAASKNLEIEKLVPRILNYQHQLYHILSKSHTRDKLDQSNLSVLSKLEKDIKLRNTLESINPLLKTFFHGKKTVVEAVITALLELVTYNKSANSCPCLTNLTMLFNKKERSNICPCITKGDLKSLDIQLLR